VLREVEIECLPGDIPNSIEANVSDLVFGKVLRVADLPHSDKIRYITDENQPVVHITTVKEEVVATPEAEAAAGATPAEPEVIKKGKQEEGEGAGAEEPKKAEKSEKKK
jgi:large subunit ribosomal protein L25